VMCGSVVCSSRRRHTRSGCDWSSDVCSSDLQGLFPLFIAAMKNYKKEVELLIEKDANVNLQTKFHRKTPLYVAVENNHLSIVKLLVEKGADVNLSDEKNKNPLYIAIEDTDDEKHRKKHKDPNVRINIIKYLIEKEADINIADNTGISPLIIALNYDEEDIVKLLVEKGANVNAETVNKPDLNILAQTPLTTAISKGKLAMVKLLVEKGAEVNHITNGGYGSVPLGIAKTLGYKYIIEREGGECKIR